MGKVKILFLAANPKNTAQLRLDEEIRAITEKIQMSHYRDALELSSAWAVRPDDLLQSFNQHQPDIVHFSGHGSEDSLALVDNNGNLKLVSTEALERLFASLKRNIRLVILNACYSQAQAKAICQHIDCVIGMNKAIGDRAAIFFAASFYRALGFGCSVEEAFEQGRLALLLEGIPEEDTPELLCKPGVNAAQLTFFSKENEYALREPQSRRGKRNKNIYASCFISYSSEDNKFVERLYADLQKNNVTCWFAPQDAKIGQKKRNSIEEAIRQHGKLLLILSKHSITSSWVEGEVETAFEEEDIRGNPLLVPIKIDNTIDSTKEGWAARIRRTLWIGDFTDWEQNEDYQKVLNRLLSALQIKNDSLT